MTITIRHKRLAKNMLKYATKKKARIKSGYSKTYSSNGLVDKTKGLKKAKKPILEQYQEELQGILNAMKLKNKNSEQYQVLVKAADIIQKQIQLLGGNSTENVEHKVIIWGEYGEEPAKD